MINGYPLRSQTGREQIKSLQVDRGSTQPVGSSFSCMAWRAIPGPLSKRKRRLDSLEAAQGAPRDANPSIVSPLVHRVPWEGISSFLLWEFLLLRSRRPAQQLSPGDPLLKSLTSWPNARVGDGAALVPVAIVSLDQNVEGGRLAFLGLSPSPCRDTSPSPFLSSPPVKIFSLPGCWKKRAGRWVLVCLWL